ncbi:probable G-protein coupled receptor No18 [Macrosteles quadrilineatus]|uniref:probable G-protein coupled receptor No18 n=1 Tax=Macrosteles quadrilineatus TaxID=74068 RepID=UPI0023E22E48|nr:probable G-protein coupled receptor No18 [Macrosteles quadrilineatus]
MDAEPTSWGWQDISLAVVFVTLIIVTVVGNVLIIAAVITTRRLRTVTNCFVMSLAIADWLVGIFVMPLAVTKHLNNGKWILGRMVCIVWVSCDVCVSTASILSLCAISIDRYFAVTQPLNYSRRRRSKRLAAIMILVVWLTAIMITCPPMIWYRTDTPYLNNSNTSTNESEVQCEYNDNKGYVVFSAMGSFFVPLTVMLYVYARISCVIAQRHDNLEAMNNSTPQVKWPLNPSVSLCDRSHTRQPGDHEQQHATGQVASQPFGKYLGNHQEYHVNSKFGCVIAQKHDNLEATNNSTPQVKWPLNPSRHDNLEAMNNSTPQVKWPLNPSVKTRQPGGHEQQHATGQVASQPFGKYLGNHQEYHVNSRLACVIAHIHDNLEAMNNSTPQVKWPLNPSRHDNLEAMNNSTPQVKWPLNPSRHDNLEAMNNSTPQVKWPLNPSVMIAQRHDNLEAMNNSTPQVKWPLNPSKLSRKPTSNLEESDLARDSSESEEVVRIASVMTRLPENRLPDRRLRYSDNSSRVSSIRRESKAAQTLSIVVGGFIACWLPFFLAYLAHPFLNPGFIPEKVMFILTWLGWINSAINPFIYAFYSPDFRLAFWRLTVRHCTPRPPPCRQLNSCSRPSILLRESVVTGYPRP